MRYETLAEVRGGVLTYRDPARFEATVQAWPDSLVHVIVVTANVFRTAAQSRYWHAGIVAPLADHCNCSPRQVHEALKTFLLPEHIVIPRVDGTTLATITIGGSTARLTKREASNLIERAETVLDQIPLDEVLTHYVPLAAETFGRQKRALCGLRVLPRRHRDDPTCPGCREALARSAFRIS